MSTWPSGEPSGSRAGRRRRSRLRGSVNEDGFGGQVGWDPGVGPGGPADGADFADGGADDGPEDARGGEADPEAVARQICLRMLASAPRTRAQLATALQRRGVPKETAEAVLGRFAEV